jgi:hypothetical protein
MKICIFTSIVVAISVCCGSFAYADNGHSYEDTVALLRETMAKNTSIFRKESYGPITFNACTLDYTVSGTYPVGDQYTLSFSNIDFSSLNYQVSKAGHDYTAFVLLNFNNKFIYRDGSKEIAVRTTVVNVRDDESAQTLFKAFLHLGELCGARQSIRSGNARDTQ